MISTLFASFLGLPCPMRTIFSIGASNLLKAPSGLPDNLCRTAANAVKPLATAGLLPKWKWCSSPGRSSMR